MPAAAPSGPTPGTGPAAAPVARPAPAGPRPCASGPAARPHLRGLPGGLGQLLGEVAQQALGHGVLADVGVNGEHGHGGGGGGSGGADGGAELRG